MSTPPGLQFYPLPSVIRLVDTRPGSGACNPRATPVAANEVFAIAARGVTCAAGTIPASAAVVVGNVTVTGPTAAGNLRLFPTSPAPGAVLSYVASETRGAAVMPALGADGSFKAQPTGGPVDLVIDIAGYWAPPGIGSSYFHPLARPIRLVDTRAGSGAPYGNSGAPLAPGQIFHVTAPGSYAGQTIPADAQALWGHSTTLNTVAAAALGLFPCTATTTTRPIGANLSPVPGVTLGNGFTVPLTAGELCVSSTAQTDYIADIWGYYSPSAVDLNGPGLQYYPLGQVLRVVDSRTAGSGYRTPGQPIIAGQVVTTDLRGVDYLDQYVPTGAAAVYASAAVLSPTATTRVFAWAGPSANPIPAVGALTTATAGQITRSALIVGLGAGGFNLELVDSPAVTDYLVDLFGYFRAPGCALTPAAGAIATYWTANGGASNPRLGCATDTTATAITGATFQRFENDAIVSSVGGTFRVPRPIFDTILAGANPTAFGYPTADPVRSALGFETQAFSAATFVAYQGHAYASTAPEVAALTAIQATWLATTAPALGNPAGALIATGGGYVQPFDGYVLAWSAATGARRIRADLWWALGRSLATSGLPTADPVEYAIGVDQAFSLGHRWLTAFGALYTAAPPPIFRSPTPGILPFQSYYLAKGGPAGVLGAPLDNGPTGFHAWGAGAYADFAGGRVFDHRTAGTHMVSGAFLTNYLARLDEVWGGGANGLPPVLNNPARPAFPTEEETTVARGRYQRFDLGGAPVELVWSNFYSPQHPVPQTLPGAGTPWLLPVGGAPFLVIGTQWRDSGGFTGPLGDPREEERSYNGSTNATLGDERDVFACMNWNSNHCESTFGWRSYRQKYMGGITCYYQESAPQRAIWLGNPSNLQCYSAAAPNVNRSYLCASTGCSQDLHPAGTGSQPPNLSPPTGNFPAGMPFVSGSHLCRGDLAQTYFVYVPGFGDVGRCGNGPVGPGGGIFEGCQGDVYTRSASCPTSLLSVDPGSVIVPDDGLYVAATPVHGIRTYNPPLGREQESAIRLALEQEGAGACTTTPLGEQGFEAPRSCKGNAGSPEFWCADFAQWIWQTAGFHTGGLNAAASSFYQYGPHDHDAAPRIGDAAVFDYTPFAQDGHGPDWAAHVAIVTYVYRDAAGLHVEVANGDWGGCPGYEDATRCDQAEFGRTARVVIKEYVSPVSMGFSTVNYISPRARATGTASCTSKLVLPVGVGPDLSNNACVQSGYDGTWFQCANATWLDEYVVPSACSVSYPLPTCAGHDCWQ